ncbi:peptide deformylase [Actinacidiphila guanduensis]|uniref:peptide deformylase n=1 Tax=Actinacidiphila guanduensis TaxID=310781 RepID=UPI002AFFAF76|nr:peptide deformylase [Actinacidiphila guanduensis]
MDAYPDLAPEAARGRYRRITVVGEQVLDRPCHPVTEFGTDELRTLIDDMFVTMYIAEGAGLAANQVDVPLRLFVYDCPDDDGVRHVGHIVNPVLDEQPTGGRHLLEESEGCLSVPGARKNVLRPERVVVRGSDIDGNPLVIEGTGYFARCLEHETDHLDGHLYLSRLDKRQRKDALRQMGSLREEVYARRRENGTKLGVEVVEP